MRRYSWLLIALLCALPFITSCSKDDSSDTSEYHDWKARNDTYFSNLRTLALDSINQAQRRYGNDWQNHSNWRTYLNFALVDSLQGKQTDSIYVQILKAGTGSGCPFSNDSVRIFFRGHMIPSQSYPEGYVFTHSGQSSIYADIFNAQTAVPSTLRASSLVRGLCTALLHMHIGDFWRVYIPYDLGYKATEKSGIQPYSTLIFEVKLVSYYRNGTSPSPWI